MEFIDGDPPAVTRGGRGNGGYPRGGRSYVEEVRALRDRPKEWAILKRCDSAASAAALAGFIRIGQLAAFRPGGAFEAASRIVDDEARVYVRYVGGGFE